MGRAARRGNPTKNILDPSGIACILLLKLNLFWTVRQPMTRSKCEYPTEWSLYPDTPQDDGERPPVDTGISDPQSKQVEPRSEPRVFAAGGSGPLMR